MKDFFANLQAGKIQPLWTDIQAWLSEHIFTANSAYQIVVIFVAFITSAILYRLMRGNIKQSIEKAKWGARTKRVARSMSKLLLPTLMLVVIFLVTKIAASDLVGMDVWFIHAMMKALFAWIVIRSFVQFIDNAAIRNSFSIIIWCIAAISIFGVMDDATKTLNEVSVDIGDFHITLLAVIKSLFFLSLLIYAASAIASLVEQRLARSKNLRRSSQVLIAKVIRIVLIIIALLIAITSSGIDLSVFAVLGGAIGIGIGLGLQKGVANLFSGMTLLLDKSIEPGDFIELDNGTIGKVQHMAVRYTEIITLDNKSVLIPNEELIAKSVINWSHGNSLVRISVPFGVHYDSDPHQVIKVAIEAAKKPTRVVRRISDPVCFMTGFGDSSLNFTLVFSIEDPENGIGNIKGEALLALWDAFKKNDIQIPYPHREVFLHKAD